MMEILGNIVLFLGIGLVLLFFLELWVKTRNGSIIIPPIALGNILFTLFLILVVVFEFSPFHLIWLLPFSMIIGFLLLIFEPVQKLLMNFLFLLASIGRSE